MKIGSGVAEETIEKDRLTQMLPYLLRTDTQNAAATCGFQLLLLKSVEILESTFRRNVLKIGTSRVDNSLIFSKEPNENSDLTYS